eukprot:4593971-Amphidinium_carterae.1
MAGLPLRFPWETPFLTRLRSRVPVPSEGVLRVPALHGSSGGEVAAPRPSVASVPSSSKRE